MDTITTFKAEQNTLTISLCLFMMLKRWSDDCCRIDRFEDERYIIGLRAIFGDEMIERLLARPNRQPVQLRTLPFRSHSFDLRQPVR